MDKTDFAAVAIGCCSIIEGTAIICGFDGAFAMGMMGIFGGIAGSILGFSYGTIKTSEKIVPIIKKIVTKEDDK